MQGETYLGGKNTKGRNGQGGVVTDFLYQNLTSKSFALIEIKTPETDIMENSTYRGDKDTNNTNEIYSPRNTLSGAIVQLQKQMNTGIKDFHNNLGNDFIDNGLNHLDINGILLIGNLEKLNLKQKESFILFRKTITNVTIITFDELFNKIKLLKKIYE